MSHQNEKSKALFAYGHESSSEAVSYYSLLRPYLWPGVLGGILLMLTNALMVYLPRLINGGITLIESETPFALNFFSYQTRIDHVLGLALLIIIVSIIGAIIRTLSRVVIFNIGRTVESDVRKILYFRLSILDDKFLHHHAVGDLMNHLTTDVTNIRMVAGFAILNIVNIIFVAAFTVPLLFSIDAALAVCALLPFPLVILSTKGLTRQMFTRSKDYQAQLSALVSTVQENLSGAHVVRLFHQQEAENQRFENVNRETYKAAMSLARIRILMFPIMRLVLGLSVGLVLLVGGFAIFKGRIGVGDFVEVNARLLQLAWPAMSLGFIFSIYNRGRASLERINKLLSTLPNITDGEDNLEQINKIKLHNLHLNVNKKYSINLEIKKGEMLGIVGASGSYKSTLLKMLYRRNPVPEGCIFFDEHDVNNLRLKSIYKNMSVVSQEPFLFHASIKENIKFAKGEASDKEILEIIKQTKLDKDIQNFKEGIDTIVGERGITLSGGQRQRVALARALLARKPLIILDDALSAVDAQTENHIIQSIKKYQKNSIIIIATHRLAAITGADQIIVLDEGQISSRGTHAELMEKSKLYQELWGVNELEGRLS